MLAGNALAQVSAEVSIASDNVFRGISLTENRAAPAVDLAFDGSAGWFVGGMASTTQFYGQTHTSPEAVVDAGYAQVTSSGLTWEAGATYSIFSNFAFWNYSEAFVGLLSENWNARLYYSPDYFGRRERTLYAEFNYSHALGDRLRLLSHLGALQGSSRFATSNPRTLDASLGLGAKLGSVNMQLKWVTRNRGSLLYPVAFADSRHEWVLSLAYSY
ncbi:MAG: TorF family putative porin [Rudaea sp.]